MALEDCHDLLVLVLLRGGKRREAHLVHLQGGRASGKQVLEDLYPAVTSGEVHCAVASAVHLVEVRPPVDEHLDDGQLVVSDGVAKRRDALEVFRLGGSVLNWRLEEKERGHVDGPPFFQAGAGQQL